MKVTFNDILKRQKRVVKNTNSNNIISEVRLYTDDGKFIESNAEQALHNWENLSEDTNIAFSRAIDIFMEICCNCNSDKCDHAFNFLLSEASKVRDVNQLINSIKYKNSRLKTKILTKINNKYNDQKGSIADTISDIQSKLNVSPSGGSNTNNTEDSDNDNSVTESYLNQLIEKCKVLNECDRILRNYNTISKRFDIDKIVSEVTTTDDIYLTINEICRCIDTYNSPFKNKYNTALEIAYYSLNKSFIEANNIIESVTDYFIFNKKITDKERNDIKFIKENNVIFESGSFDTINYLFEDETKEPIKETKQINADDYGVDFYTLNENDLTDTAKEIKNDIKQWPKGNPEERKDEEVKKMVDDFRKQCAKADKDDKSVTLATHLKSLIKKLFTRNPEQIIEELPSIFAIIRGTFIATTMGINIIVGILVLLINCITKLALERKQVDKFIDKYQNEITATKNKLEKTKDQNQKDRLEKYLKELQKDLEKLKDYARTLHSEDENEKRDEEDMSSYDFDDDFDDWDFGFDDNEFDFEESFTQSQLNNLATITVISNMVESLNESLDNKNIDNIVFENISKFSDDALDNITDFAITASSVINKNKLCESLENYRADLRNNANNTYDYMRIDTINNNIYKIKESSNTYNINNDPKGVMSVLTWLNEVAKYNSDVQYINEMNITNSLKIALKRLKNTAMKLSDKEKQISNALDVSVNNASKSIEQAMMNDNREAIIRGRVLPSASKTIKLAIATGAAWAINPALAVINALGMFACSKNLKAKERQLVLDDIEIELKMCERYLRQAEEKNDMEAIRQIEITQRNLERQRQRIKYKMHVIYNQRTPDVKSKDD